VAMRPDRRPPPLVSRFFKGDTNVNSGEMSRERLRLVPTGKEK
jgi:hypothetical protein